MKKKQNINMIIGGTMYRAIEQMDQPSLNRVAVALLNEMQAIQNAMAGNIAKGTATELKAKAKKVMQRMNQIQQFQRNLVTKPKAVEVG